MKGLLNQKSKHDDLHFRPDKLLAPTLGTSVESYEQYLASYRTYVTSLTALRQEFWASAGKPKAAVGIVESKTKKEVVQYVLTFDLVYRDGPPSRTNPAKTSKVRLVFENEGKARSYQQRLALGTLPDYPMTPVSQVTQEIRSTSVLSFGTAPLYTAEGLRQTFVKPSVSKKEKPAPTASTNEALKKAKKVRQRVARKARKVAKKLEELHQIRDVAKAQAEADRWVEVVRKKRSKKRVNRKVDKDPKGKGVDRQTTPTPSTAPSSVSGVSVLDTAEKVQSVVSSTIKGVLQGEEKLNRREKRSALVVKNPDFLNFKKVFGSGSKDSLV